MNILWFLLVIVLVIFGIFMSFYFKFDNYKIFKMIKDLKNSNKTGLFLSLGTKIGVGSIIGTSMSIYIGGPGSILWIIIFTAFTSSLVYYESYIGCIYKERINNNYVGGPYFYIKNGVKNKSLAYGSLILLIICYSFFFQMIQTNTITNILEINYSISKLLIFIIFFFLVVFILFFSVKELLTSMNKLVPIMCLIYILLGITAIIINNDSLGKIICNIFNTAFTKKGILIGALIGIKRSIFLNEIMIGTSSTASCVDSVDPKKSAMMQTLGVYFITLVVSVITGFLILIFKENNISIITSYNELISNVFIYHFGRFGIILLTIILFLFAITTIISGCYIGISNLEVITKNKRIILFFRIFMLLFCMSGIVINSNIIWNLIDYIMYVLIIINTYSLFKIYRRSKNDRK